MVINEMEFSLGNDSINKDITICETKSDKFYNVKTDKDMFVGKDVMNFYRIQKNKPIEVYKNKRIVLPVVATKLNSFEYNVIELRDPNNATNIEKKLLKGLKEVSYIELTYKDKTISKTLKEPINIEDFKFDRNTRWCTRGNERKNSFGDYIYLGWSNRGGSCYKGYYIGFQIDGKYYGLVHTCDCGNCGHYENQIRFGDYRRCLGNGSTDKTEKISIRIGG